MNLRLQTYAAAALGKMFQYKVSWLDEFLPTLLAHSVGQPAAATLLQQVYAELQVYKRTGFKYDSLIFKTLAFPCFNEFHELFYPDGVKIIPSNISEYLTEVSLAFWIMDYGGKTTYGDLLLHTNSYTLEEVELLVSVLNQQFHLVCKVSQRRPNQWAILIPKRELHKVRALVSIYIHSSVEYQISE